jgi:hypothetical protein
MKALTLALLLTTTIAVPARPERRPTGHTEHSRGGRWYLAATGHAVYCYGPVMTLPTPNGDLQRVATFCRDGQAVVPLKD